MGCSDEAAKLTSLCGDIQNNLLNSKNNKQNYTPNEVTLPRSCHYNCMIELDTAHQQNTKSNTGDIFDQDCHKKIVEETDEYINNYKAIEIYNQIYKFINFHHSLIHNIEYYEIKYAKTVNNDNIIEIGNGKGYCKGCGNSYIQNELKKTIFIKFMEDKIKRKNKIPTKTEAKATTTIAIVIHSNIKRSSKRSQQSRRIDKILCEQCYPFECHNRIGCCIRQQRRRTILQTPNYSCNNKSTFTYSKNNKYNNIRVCRYCHYPVKIRQLLTTYKCHHYHRHHHHHYHHHQHHHHHHHDQYSECNKCYESHIQPAQSRTLQHHHYQRNIHKRNPEGNKITGNERSANRFKFSTTSLTASVSAPLVPFVRFDKKNNNNANVYNCLQQSMSYAYNNILPNTIQLKDNIAERLHYYTFTSATLFDDVHVMQKIPKLHYDSNHLQNILQKQQHKYDFNSQSSVSSGNYYYSQGIRSNNNHRNIHNCNNQFEKNSSNESTINNARTNTTTTIKTTTAAITTCTNASTINSSSNTNSNSAAVIIRSTIYNTTFFASILNYIGRHSYYHMLRNSLNLYTAYSILFMLCYFTTAASASDITINKMEQYSSIDKHPVMLIDWSKFDESSSDKEILDLLLEKNRYDKRLLPPVNGTLTVNVNVLLLSLASPDESSLKYEVEFLLNQQWNDPRLEYGNKSHYDFLNALHHHESIWTPDTYFIMHGDFKDPIIPMHFALRIYRNGTITYAMRRHLILSCQGSLHIFPFDDPKCSFSMESISYEESQIKYVWKNDEDTLRKSPSLTTLNAYLIRNKTTPCDQNSWRGNYSCLRVDLIFTRDRAFYFTTVFIPGIILVTSSFITFWLEWNAVPARSMIGVTTMLNFFTTSNGFRSTLPVVSNLTAMNVWDGVCMCFIYASLLEFVCVNYMGRKRPQHNAVYRPGENPVTQRLPAVLSRIGVILASPLVVIEREFHAALHSQRETARLEALGNIAATSAGQHIEHKAPRRLFHQESRVDIVSSAVQHLRDRTFQTTSTLSAVSTINHSKERQSRKDQAYEHTYYEPQVNIAVGRTKVEAENQFPSPSTSDQARQYKRLHSMSTNTPPLVLREDLKKSDIEMTERQTVMAPLKPPRKKPSRSTSPSISYETVQGISSISVNGRKPLPTTHEQTGEKKRDTGGPNEIVACTTCGGGSSSPCTHSANNGCPTDTCFVQVRKKEPPHPIRIAKTIDVIARITFPTAYAIFLIFFFVHYKGFS